MAQIPQFRHFTPDELVHCSVPEMQAIGKALAEGQDQHPFNKDDTMTQKDAAEAMAWRPPTTAFEAADRREPGRFGIVVKPVES